MSSRIFRSVVLSFSMLLLAGADAAHAGPEPTPMVCDFIRSLLPPAVINAAVASPQLVDGWNKPANPNVLPSRFNTPRTWLSIRNTSIPWHPVYNSLVFSAGCPRAGICTALSCNDGDPCTVDTCGATGCVHTRSSVPTDSCPVGVIAGTAMSSRALGLNDGGQVVGIRKITPTGPERAYVWSASTGIVDLAVGGPGIASAATGINDSGQISASTTVALRFTNGRMETLGTLPGYFTATTGGINSKGTVVGTALAGPMSRAFRYLDTSGMADLGTLPGGQNSGATAVSDYGDTFGWSSVAGTPLGDTWNPGHAFVYLANGSAMHDLNDDLSPGSGWELRRANGTNESGSVAVGFGLFNGGIRAFRFADGVVSDLGTGSVPDVQRSWANAIDKNRNVVGAMEVGATQSVTKAFFYSEGDAALYDLNTLVTVPTGLFLNVATSISNGLICGWGTYSSTIVSWCLDLPTDQKGLPGPLRLLPVGYIHSELVGDLKPVADKEWMKLTKLPSSTRAVFIANNGRGAGGLTNYWACFEPNDEALSCPSTYNGGPGETVNTDLQSRLQTLRSAHPDMVILGYVEDINYHMWGVYDSKARTLTEKSKAKGGTEFTGRGVEHAYADIEMWRNYKTADGTTLLLNGIFFDDANRYDPGDPRCEELFTKAICQVRTDLDAQIGLLDEVMARGPSEFPRAAGSAAPGIAFFNWGGVEKKMGDYVGCLAARASQSSDRFGARFVTMETSRKNYVNPKEVEARFDLDDMQWVRKFHPRRFGHIVHDSLADGSDIANIVRIAVKSNAQYLYFTDSPGSPGSPGKPANFYNPMVSDDGPPKTLWEKEIEAVNETQGHRFTGAFDEASYIPYDPAMCPFTYSRW